jgi:hypothetical protein
VLGSPYLVRSMPRSPVGGLLKMVLATCTYMQVIMAKCVVTQTNGGPAKDSVGCAHADAAGNGQMCRPAIAAL